MLRVSRFVGWLFTFCGLLFSGIACQQDESTTGTGQDEESNRSIRGTVKHTYQQNPASDSGVAGATVRLFEDEQSRQQGVDIARERQTDTAGQVQFYYLERDSYFVKVSHPELGTQSTDISTPAGTVSHLQVIYP